MKVVIACEYSGRVRNEFAKLGHNVISCDFLPTESPGKHYQGDIRDILNDGWDLMIGHPPCTYLCNSGVRWLYEKAGRWKQMMDAAKFFKMLLNANIPKICLENPILHKYAVERIGKKYSQIIQPWQFGHGETKATCLWLKGLPLLMPTNIVEGRENRVHKMLPSLNRGKLRSLTYKGVAKAMAKQWG